MTNSSSSIHPDYINTPALVFCDGMMAGMYFWLISSIICSAVGLPASLLILWEMFKTHVRKGSPFKSHNLFVLNLSSMDTIFLAFLPTVVINNVYYNVLLVESIGNIIYAFNICGRPLLMACICIDCYLAVIHPIFYLRMSLTPKVLLVAVVWAVSITCGILYVIYKKLYFSLFSTVCFIIAMIIIGICDSFILYSLIRTSGTRGIHPQKQRAIYTLVSSFVMATISYLPPVLLFVFGLSLISDHQVFICIIGIPITITSTLGSAVMPLLYLYNIGKLNCQRFRCSFFFRR